MIMRMYTCHPLGSRNVLSAFKGNLDMREKTVFMFIV